MYWEVGIKIGQERGQVTVHPQTLQDNEYTNAVEYVMEMAQAMYPKHKIEFEFVKEYDNA